MSSSFYIPASALVVMAHPDDIEFSCAGTVARWTQAGSRVGYVLCTSGDVGIAEPGMTRARAAEIREGEAVTAADIAGVRDVTFLREPDGLLQPTLELRHKLVREIRRFQPEVLVCSDPTLVFSRDDYLNHPDHRAAGLAALEAVFPGAGQPNLFAELEAEGLRAHKTRKVYVTSRDHIDLYVNIEETLAVKVAALRAHASQMQDWDPEPMVRQWAAERAKGKEMAFAESFRVVTLEDDETWERLHPPVTDR